MAPPVAGLNPFGWVKDQVLGGLQWGVEEAGGFVTNLLAGIADALVPDWVAKQAINLIGWTVSVPNYAAPGSGAGGYAFGGLNTLRGTLTWVGITLIPLTLTVTVGRATLGLGHDHPIAPLTRLLSSIALVVFYPFAWGQVASAANQLTHAILKTPAVEQGLNTQFEWMVGAGALRGVPMLGAVMLLIAAVLLIAVLVLKLVIVVVGAVLFAAGVLMPGIAATERGHAVAQAWITATVGLMAIPVLWTIVFAVAALLAHDAPTAASAVGGSGKLRELIGGLTLAVGSIAATAVCIKISTFLGSIVMGQVTGTLALVGAGSGTPAGGPRGTAAAVAGKLSAFGSRVGGAARQVAGDGLSGRARSGALAALGGSAAIMGGGLVGVAAAGGRRAAATGAQAARRVAHRAPAGAVASRLARSARAGWNDPQAAPRWGTPAPSAGTTSPPSTSPEPPGPTAAPSAPSSPASGTQAPDRPSPRPSGPPPSSQPPTPAPPEPGAAPRPPDPPGDSSPPASRERPSSPPPDRQSSPPRPDPPPHPDRSPDADPPASGGTKGGRDEDVPPSR